MGCTWLSLSGRRTLLSIRMRGHGRRGSTRLTEPGSSLTDGMDAPAWRGIMRANRIMMRSQTGQKTTEASMHTIPLAGIHPVGLDLGKRFSQVHGVDAQGDKVVHVRLHRSDVEPFFALLPCCRVAMETCGGWRSHLLEQVLGIRSVHRTTASAITVL